VTDAPGRLTDLSVTGLALLERVRLAVPEGFTVVTGETGAGKSLLIDALGLALGARADPGLVRQGEAAARVEALFDRLPEPLIVAREVNAAGRSTARIDDEAVTAGRLAEVARELVEIHGQHDQQRLLDARRQRDLLDAFASAAELVDAVARAVGAWRETRDALERAAVDPREAARRLAVLEHEVAEIDAARIRVGEAAALEERLGAARNAEAIARGATAVEEALVGAEGAGGEDAANARDLLARAARAAADTARLDPRWQATADRLAGLEAEIADVAAEARGVADSLDHDPDELRRLEERLSAIYALERRYGDDEAAVLDHRARAAAAAAELRDLDARAAALGAEAEERLAAVAAAARALSEARSAAAARIGPAVEAVVREVGMERARFAVEVRRRPAADGSPSVVIDGAACAFDGSGIDDVAFVIAPNPGEPAMPLARIASGGELSRVALAVEQVLAGADATPTLVFDEIDAGIGGRSAEPVARALWRLGRGRAVLCVTHLPVIAAYADAHVRIAKGTHGGRTVTEVTEVTGEERVAEIALMLGGPGGGPAATAGAREMLERAAAWRTHPA
jgi:DNA repair protein RecN (Recombination protein N)